MEKPPEPREIFFWRKKPPKADFSAKKKFLALRAFFPLHRGVPCAIHRPPCICLAGLARQTDTGRVVYSTWDPPKKVKKNHECVFCKIRCFMIFGQRLPSSQPFDLIGLCNKNQRVACLWKSEFPAPNQDFSTTGLVKSLFEILDLEAPSPRERE